MHIAGATTCTGYVARGIAGKDASCVHSHQTAASDILFGGYFYDHVARGIASGQGDGIPIRLTYHAADIDHSLHCGRGTASGDGTAPLSTHHTADVHRAADAARHRAVFNGTPAKSYHAANTAAIYLIACYLYALHHHVLHRTSTIEMAEQTRIFVICCKGQPRDGMTATVEGAFV